MSFFKQIKDEDRVFVIAEIGKNFIQTEDPRSVEEYVVCAKQLIDDAAEARVDAVKFQTHEVEDEQMDIEVVSPHFKGSDRYSWVKRNTVATPKEFFAELKRYAEEKGLVFFSTPMSRKAAEKLESINVPLWKVGSGDIQDFVMIDYLISTGKPIMISTGMVGHDELEEVVNYITKGGNPISILYCISEYPAPANYFNLATIEYLREKYPHALIGFSDHSVGDNTIPLKAVKAGARVIEKHFSRSRDLWGSDHKVSMVKDEMKELVDLIRAKAYLDIEIGEHYGQKDRELQGKNNRFRPYFNKSIVAGKDIDEGEIITKDVVYAMRPRVHIDGLSSRHFHTIVGKKAKRKLKKYDPISETDVE